MTLEDVSNLDFMWLVGLLEGEGCFGLHSQTTVNKDGTTHTYKRPNISVASTDYDVICKAHALLKASTQITEVIGRKANYKKVYGVHINGGLAIEWMEKLYPFMSIRRKEAIEKALQNNTYKDLTNHGRKLNLEQAEEIRRLYNTTTLTLVEIGRLFNVSVSHVCRIIKGSRYGTAQIPRKTAEATSVRLSKAAKVRWDKYKEENTQ